MLSTRRIGNQGLRPTTRYVAYLGPESAKPVWQITMFPDEYDCVVRLSFVPVPALYGLAVALNGRPLNGLLNVAVVHWFRPIGASVKPHWSINSPPISAQPGLLAKPPSDVPAFHTPDWQS